MINLPKLTQSRANNLLTEVSTSEGVADASAMFGNQTFQQAHSGSKSFAQWIALAAQIVSAVLASSYFFYKIALPAVPFEISYLSEGIAGVFTLGILLMLEYLKKQLLMSLAVSFFKAKSKKVAFKVWLLPVAILLTVLSVYTSFEGAKLFVLQSDQSATISADYGAKVAALSAEEADFRKSISWQGKIDMTNKANAKILAGFEDRKAALHAEKNTQIGTHQTDIGSKGMNVAIFSLIMEIVAICAFCFICYVNFYVFVESHTQIAHIESESLPVEKVGFSAVPNSTIAPNNQGQKVGFQFTTSPVVTSPVVNKINEGNKICLHCGKAFTYKHHVQKYCNEECRIAFWENKTGKKFNKKKGGKI